MSSGAVSGGELLLHQLLREAGLDGWSAGATITDAGASSWAWICHSTGTRVVIEIDGFRAHSSKRSFIEDRRRQNRLIAADYRVLRYTWDDLQNRPQEVIVEIRAALLRE